MPKPPSWLPYLGPLLAAGVGAAVGRYGLDGGFWTVLIAALVAGFVPIIGYRLWKRAHHQR
jgi:O-antigen/teichoic acid export membrane protein